MKLIVMFIIFAFSSLFAKNSAPEIFPAIVEQLVYYKDDHFKIFYGGPIQNGVGANWIMPVLFEDEDHQVRAVYEISFINCAPYLEKTDNIEVAYIKVSDVDVKFKNLLSKEYELFSSYVNNRDENKRSVLIREVDVSNIYYPEVFTASIYSDFRKSDVDAILTFLHRKFHTESTVKELTPIIEQKRQSTKEEGLIGQKRVCSKIQGENYFFNVEHYFIKDDVWQSYYVITPENTTGDHFSLGERVLLRIDSGCSSGQIYCDESCDCQDQFFSALFSMVENEGNSSLLIHIPTQDGRGLGVAPKAETEIYKQGGIGRINRTEPLNTIEAAVLLYRTMDFDVRTYDGVAKILKMYNVLAVDLLTDNKRKIKSLDHSGISVNRKKTRTNKVTCLNHLFAKKNTNHYFSD